MAIEKIQIQKLNIKEPSVNFKSDNMQSSGTIREGLTPKEKILGALAIVGTAVAGIAIVKAHGKSSLLKDATEKLKKAEENNKKLSDEVSSLSEKVNESTEKLKKAEENNKKLSDEVSSLSEKVKASTEKSDVPKAEPLPVEEPQTPDVPKAEPLPVEQPQTPVVHEAEPLPVEQPQTFVVHEAEPLPVEQPQTPDVPKAEPLPVEQPQTPDVPKTEPSPVETAKWWQFGKKRKIKREQQKTAEEVKKQAEIEAEKRKQALVKKCSSMSEEELKQINTSAMSLEEKNIIKNSLESLMTKRFESLSTDELAAITIKLPYEDGFGIAKRILEKKRIDNVSNLDIDQLLGEYRKVYSERKVLNQRADRNSDKGICGKYWMDTYIYRIEDCVSEKGYFFTDVLGRKLDVVKENTLDAHQELFIHPYDKIKIGHSEAYSRGCIYNNFRFDPKNFPGTYPQKGEYTRNDIAMERYLNRKDGHRAVLKLNGDAFKAVNPHGQCGYAYMPGSGFRRWELLHGMNSEREFVTILSYLKFYNSRPCGFSLNIKGDVSEKDMREIRKIMIEKGYAAGDLGNTESESIISDILNYLNGKN